MVDLEFKYGLPFCKIEVIHNNRRLMLNNVLIDTGFGGTLLKMDRIEEIDITIDINDSIETIHGVGGSEFVYKNTQHIITKIVIQLKPTDISGFCCA